MSHIKRIAPRRNGWDYLMLWIKGIVMGTANKVPGVSGGTAALVLGYYEEFIFSLRRINVEAFKMLFTGRFRDFWIHTNMAFLLCITAYRYGLFSLVWWLEVLCTLSANTRLGVERL